MQFCYQIAYVTPEKNVILEHNGKDEIGLPEITFGRFEDLIVVAKRFCNTKFLADPKVIELYFVSSINTVVITFIVLVDQNAVKMFKSNDEFCKGVLTISSKLSDLPDLTKETKRILSNLVWPTVEVFDLYKWFNQREGANSDYLGKIFHEC